MTGATHAVIAQVAAAAMWPGAPIEVYLCAIVGGLAPDLDSPGSAITRMRGIAPLGRAASSVAQVAHVRHRGPTHSLLALALVVFLAPLVMTRLLHWPPTFAPAFALGYALHIAADTLTRSGVPILWPLSNVRLSPLPRALRLRTGGLPEKGVLILLAWRALAGLAQRGA